MPVLYIQAGEVVHELPWANKHSPNEEVGRTALLVRVNGAPISGKITKIESDGLTTYIYLGSEKAKSLPKLKKKVKTPAKKPDKKVIKAKKKK